MDTREVLDEAYERLAGTGPEFEGFLSNHGPMAADALIRLGHADSVEGWVNKYQYKLEEAPEERFAISLDQWREPLGDASRLGDWCALFARLVQERPWNELVVEWWPRLMPGAVASATHCLIRTGHAVRALRENETPQRVNELGRALGYWAARWQPFPALSPQGNIDAGQALEGVPGIASHGGSRTRLAQVADSQSWRSSLTRLRAVDAAEDVPRAIDALVDAAVAGYGRWGHHNPVMLVHSATGPRAVGLLLPVLPVEFWADAYDAAWLVSAAISGAYRADAVKSVPIAEGREASTIEEVSHLASETGDEHAIKFAEVAVESHRRGSPHALAAAGRAASLLGA